MVLGTMDFRNVDFEIAINAIIGLLVIDNDSDEVIVRSEQKNGISEQKTAFNTSSNPV